LAPVFDIETLFQTILCAQGGHEACVAEMWDWAALNALVEDLLKKLTERHHKRFRVRFLMTDKLCGTDMETPAGRRCPRGVSCLSLKSGIFRAYCVPSVSPVTRMPVIEILFHYHSRFCINGTMGS